MMHMEHITFLSASRDPPHLKNGDFCIGTAVGEDQRFFTMCALINEVVVGFACVMKLLRLLLVLRIWKREMFHPQSQLATARGRDHIHPCCVPAASQDVAVS